MLPIGNLTVFLSVPPSYQYLHSPLTIRSFSHFSFGLLRKSTLLSEEHPKDYRTTSEGKWKRGGQIWSNVDKHGQRWTNMDKGGQTWTNIDNGGQAWTNMDKRGQTWTNIDKCGQIWSELVK